MKDDKELDEIVEHMALLIGESKDERRDDTSQIFDEMKAAIQSLIDTRVREARIDELNRLYHKIHTPSIQPLTADFHINNRLAELKEGKQND